VQRGPWWGMHGLPRPGPTRRRRSPPFASRKSQGGDAQGVATAGGTRVNRGCAHIHGVTSPTPPHLHPRICGLPVSLCTRSDAVTTHSLLPLYWYRVTVLVATAAKLGGLPFHTIKGTFFHHVSCCVPQSIRCLPFWCVYVCACLCVCVCLCVSVRRIRSKMLKEATSPSGINLAGLRIGVPRRFFFEDMDPNVEKVGPPLHSHVPLHV
jgi:hypothetical protein